MGAERIECRHEDLAVGQRCPLCGQGTLYELPPGVEIRIDSHALLSAMRYALHKLRGSACGQIFTTPLPRDAGQEQDSPRARAVLVVGRYYLSLPCYRLQGYQAMLGVPMPDSTPWDQIERVGDCCYVVFAYLELLAAQGVSRPKERPGICTTALVIRVGERLIYLYYAGRAVMGFEFPEDAEKVLRVLPKRFGKYDLTIHPAKTRLVAFGRPRDTQGKRPGTCDFLGVTHYWGKSRRDQWIVKSKTALQRLSRGRKRIDEWCRRNRHEPVVEQHRELCRKIRGHYAYYGITGNGLWLKKCHQGVRRIWQKWLHRRSRTPSEMPWDRFVRFMERYRFPPISVVHSVYAAKPCPEEPGAFIALVRVCGGAVRVTCGSTRNRGPAFYRKGLSSFRGTL